MATKNPPVKNAAFTFRIVLFAQSDNQIKTTPTIAAGDFKVSVDGAALANPGTLPSESPASSGQVLITLTADEMNGDEIVVRWIDASGDEWHSGAVVLHTVASGQQFDQLATATALATVDGIVDDILVDTAVIGAPAGASIAADIAAIEAQTDDIGVAGAGLTALGDTRLANLDATVSSRAAASTLTTIGSRVGTFTGTGVNNIKGYLEAMMRSDTTTPSDVGGTFDDATDSLQAIRDNTGTPAGASVSADIAAVSALIAALNNLSAAQVNAEVVDVIRTDTIPDSVAADGSASTIAQAVYLMLQFLTEKAVSGTTVTVKKADGSTSLATFTLDDGTSPSSITRAS